MAGGVGGGSSTSSSSIQSKVGEGLGAGTGVAGGGAERQKMNTRSRFSAENVSERLSGLGPEPSLPALHPKRKARDPG